MAHLLSLYLKTLAPRLPSSPPPSQSDSAFSFVFPAAAILDFPSSSQERHVSGTGKPVLRSSSDPPVHSRCLQPEDLTASPPPPLKRQVGLLPVDGVLVEPEGTLMQRGGLSQPLHTRVRLIIGSLGRQTQHAVLPYMPLVLGIC